LACGGVRGTMPNKVLTTKIAYATRFCGSSKVLRHIFLDRGRLKKPWSGAEGGRADRRGGSYQLSFAANIEMEPV